MGAVSWFREHLVAAVVCFVFAATLVAASVVALAVWIAIAAVSAGSGGAPVGVLFPLILLGVVVGLPLAAASLVGVAVGVLARGAALASRRWAWLDRAAAAVERRSSLARLLRVSAAARALDGRSPEERASARVERLKREYVDGELTESELERRTRDVLAETMGDGTGPASVDGRRGAVDRDRDH